MSDSVSAAYNLLLKVTETLDLGADLAANPSRIVQITSANGTLNGSSGVPATKVWSDERTIDGTGTEDLDLTALARSPLASIDATDLKLQALMIKAKSTNGAGGLEIKEGAANGYLLFGTTGDKVTLLPGQMVLLFFNEKLANIDATHKVVTFTGTVADVYEIVMVFG